MSSLSLVQAGEQSLDSLVAVGRVSGGSAATGGGLDPTILCSTIAAASPPRHGQNHPAAGPACSPTLSGATGAHQVARTKKRFLVSPTPSCSWSNVKPGHPSRTSPPLMYSLLLSNRFDILDLSQFPPLDQQTNSSLPSPQTGMLQEPSSITLGRQKPRTPGVSWPKRFWVPVNFTPCPQRNARRASTPTPPRSPGSGSAVIGGASPDPSTRGDERHIS